MQLPEVLKIAIESSLDSFSLHSLAQARKALSQKYRQSGAGHYMETQEERLSYLISRMPATYAAIDRALSSIKKIHGEEIKSFLDLGAGPGTGMWAMMNHFPSLDAISLLERDPMLMEKGKAFAALADTSLVQKSCWIEGDLLSPPPLAPHDAVLLSYVMGEISPEKRALVIDHAFFLSRKWLLIIEPGTPEGFLRIEEARKQLIAKGGCLIAPCPHTRPCPFTALASSEKGWCHFSARVERSSFHRKLKEGTLGYEDEKFSYIAISKTPLSLPSLRIISPIQRHGGHLRVEGCTKEGIKRGVISKKKGEIYKQLKKAEWGDAFSEPIALNGQEELLPPPPR